MRRVLTTVTAALVLCGGLTACGSTETARSTSIDILIKDGTVSPSGERVNASVDEPITLNIDADAAGELHVHSDPEQEVTFEEGTSTHELTITRPGVVDVEVHDLEQVVVQLEVE